MMNEYKPEDPRKFNPLPGVPQFDWLPNYEELNRSILNEICGAVGLPAYLFADPIVYYDPYPEQSE